MRLPPFALERWFARYEFEVELLLCSSDCQSMRVADLLALEPDAAEKLQEVWLGYTPPQGDPFLREGIAKLYETIGVDDVLVHAGAEEAIFNFVHAVLGPGDHVVVHRPAYQSLYSVPEGAGCTVAPWTAREEEGWALDPDDLPALMEPDTRAVIVNVPHNPTGHLMTADAWRRLVEVCAERGVILFSDEVYRWSEYEPARRLPAACDLDERAVSLGVMSKSFGLPGLRIGWIATRNREVYARMADFKDYTTICNSAPSEFLAALALRHRDALLGRTVGIIQRNLLLADAFFARHVDRLRWVRPQAGPIAFPALVNGEDAVRLCERLVQEAGVLLLPGGAYGPIWNAHVRLGLGRENFPQGLERLDAFLQAHGDQTLGPPAC